MKACKIDIKQTWIDLPDGQPVYKEVVRQQMEVHFKEDGKMPDVAKMLDNNYYPIKVREPGSYLDTTVYLIKENEEKIFKELLTIQDTELTKFIDRAVEEKWMMQHYLITADERKRIKKLHWYERLFNKF